MNLLMKNAVVTGLLSVGLYASAPAGAVTVQKILSVPGGGACQLSIPTTDTGVRPKATGYRNEGTINAFVICSFLNVRNNVPTQVIAQMFSFDGASHTFNCTFASTLSFGGPLYLTKSVTTDALGSQTDFSVVTADNVIQRYNTMTCVLPPGVAINGTQAVYDDDVGA